MSPNRLHVCATKWVSRREASKFDHLCANADHCFIDPAATSAGGGNFGERCFVGGNANVWDHAHAGSRAVIGSDTAPPWNVPQARTREALGTALAYPGRLADRMMDSLGDRLLRWRLPRRAVLRQLLRYGLVGVMTNAVGYSLFILLTYFGMDAKVAITILYPLAICFTFAANRKWTFEHRGKLLRSANAYVTVHGMGYLLNLGLLALLTDILGYPYQAVQAVAIFVVAGFVFVASKFLVFTHR